MNKKQRKALALKHFNALAPLMFYQTFICYKNKFGYINYWDCVFQCFAICAEPIQFPGEAHGVYRDDEIVYQLFLAYNVLNSLGIDNVKLNVVFS
jgi:hypothetical protein